MVGSSSDSVLLETEEIEAGIPICGGNLSTPVSTSRKFIIE
jgi:hypothetical protein